MAGKKVETSLTVEDKKGKAPSKLPKKLVLTKIMSKRSILITNFVKIHQIQHRKSLYHFQFFQFHQFMKVNLPYDFRVCIRIGQAGLCGMQKTFPSKGVSRVFWCQNQGFPVFLLKRYGFTPLHPHAEIVFAPSPRSPYNLPVPPPLLRSPLSRSHPLVLSVLGLPYRNVLPYFFFVLMRFECKTLYPLAYDNDFLISRRNASIFVLGGTSVFPNFAAISNESKLT